MGGDGSFSIPVAPGAPPSLGGQVLVGIRPKDIRLEAVDVEGVQTTVQVKDLHTLGQTTVVTVMAGSLEMKAKVPTYDAPARESNVGLVVDTEMLHYFDMETRRRIV